MTARKAPAPFRRRRRIRSLPLLLLLVAAAMVQGCHGRCMSPDMLPTVAEQLREARDGNEGEVVARLTFAYDDTAAHSTASIAPCSVNVYDYDQGGILIDNLQLYVVEEIFAGGITNNVSVGDQLPIIWSTDTGYRNSLPARFDDDANGFLAKLDPVAVCYINGDSTYPEPYPAPMRPYSMSSCNLRMNRPWSEVDEEEREVLWSDEEGGIGGGGSGAPTTSPTKGPILPAEPVEVALSAESPTINGIDGGATDSVGDAGGPTHAPTRSPTVAPEMPAAALPEETPSIGATNGEDSARAEAAPTRGPVVPEGTATDTGAPTTVPATALLAENGATGRGRSFAIIAPFIALAISFSSR